MPETIREYKTGTTFNELSRRAEAAGAVRCCERRQTKAPGHGRFARQAAREAHAAQSGGTRFQESLVCKGSQRTSSSGIGIEKKHGGQRVTRMLCLCGYRGRSAVRGA